MRNSIFCVPFFKSICIAIIIFLAPSQAWALWSGADCNRAKTTYTNVSWIYNSALDFAGWANTAAVGSSVTVAYVDFTTLNYYHNINYLCAVFNTNFDTRNTTWTVSNGNTTPAVGNYYQVPGFKGIEFKIKLDYSDAPLDVYSSPYNRGTAANNRSVTMPGGTLPTSNFGACTHYGKGTSSSSMVCSFAGNSANNTSYASAYLQKVWNYQLIAFKTLANPTLAPFPTDANTLPVVKLNGNFWDEAASGYPGIYCIGCIGANGKPPGVTTAASCEIATSVNQTVNMNPQNVDWNDFSQTENSLKVTPTWTPFFVMFSCNQLPTVARFYAKDATSGASLSEPAGKLLNSNGGNVGVQVFYKTVANSTCLGTPTLSNGAVVPLNNSTLVNIPGGTSTAYPIQYFCARYYTTATSGDSTAVNGIKAGAVTSTMSYTFQYE